MPSGPPPFCLSYLGTVKALGEYGGTGWEQSSIDKAVLKDGSLSATEKMRQLFGMKLDYSSYPKVKVTSVDELMPDGKTPSRAAKAKVAPGDLLISIVTERITQLASWTGEDPDDAIVSKIGRRVERAEKVSASFMFIRGKYRHFYLQLRADVPELDATMEGKKFTEIKPGGWADRRGLKVGDAVVLANDVLAEADVAKLSTMLGKEGQRPLHMLVRRGKEFEAISRSRETDVKRELPSKWKDFAKASAGPGGPEKTSPTSGSPPPAGGGGEKKSSSSTSGTKEGKNSGSSSSSQQNSVPFQIGYLAGAKDVKELGLTGWEQRSMDTSILNADIPSRDKLAQLFGFFLDWTGFPYVRVSKLQGGSSSRAGTAGVEPGDLLVQIFKDRVSSVNAWPGTSPDGAIVAKIKEQMKTRASGDASARFVFFRKKFERQYAQLEFTDSGTGKGEKTLGLSCDTDPGKGVIQVRYVTEGGWASKNGIKPGDRIVVVLDAMVGTENCDKVKQKIDDGLKKPAYLMFRREPSFPDTVRGLEVKAMRRLPSKWADAVKKSGVGTALGDDAAAKAASKGPEPAPDAAGVMGGLAQSAFGFLDGYLGNPLAQGVAAQNKLDPHDLSALEILGKLNRVLFDEHFGRTDTMHAWKPLVNALEVIRRHEARDEARERQFRGLDKLLNEARASLSTTLGARGAMEHLALTHAGGVANRQADRGMERQKQIESLVRQGISDSQAVVSLKEQEKWNQYQRKVDAELARRAAGRNATAAMSAVPVAATTRAPGNMPGNFYNDTDARSQASTAVRLEPQDRGFSSGSSSSSSSANWWQQLQHMWQAPEAAPAGDGYGGNDGELYGGHQKWYRQDQQAHYAGGEYDHNAYPPAYHEYYAGHHQQDQAGHSHWYDDQNAAGRNTKDPPGLGSSRGGMDVSSQRSRSGSPATPGHDPVHRGYDLDALSSSAAHHEANILTATIAQGRIESVALTEALVAAREESAKLQKTREEKLFLEDEIERHRMELDNLQKGVTKIHFTRGNLAASEEAAALEAKKKRDLEERDDVRRYYEKKLSKAKEKLKKRRGGRGRGNVEGRSDVVMAKLLETCYEKIYSRMKSKGSSREKMDIKSGGDLHAGDVFAESPNAFVRNNARGGGRGAAETLGGSPVGGGSSRPFGRAADYYAGKLMGTTG